MAKNKKIAVAQPVVVEATDTPVEAPAPAPATTMAKLKAKSAELKLTKTGMPALPKMPRVRKPKPAQDCACGCGNQTKGGRFIPGHDARLHGWALRVERGICTLEQVAELAGQGTADTVKAHMAAGK